jgi:hypothetical protein
VDGREPVGQARYQERLWPSAGIWLIGLLLGLALGVVPAPVSGTAAIAVAVLGAVVLITALVLTSPAVTVDPTTFRAGRAHIDRRYIASVEPLDAEGVRQARGRRLDARAHLCMRGWLREGVKVTLRDPDDPTPYWLVSSRRPQDLAAALAPDLPGTPG